MSLLKRKLDKIQMNGIVVAGASAGTGAGTLFTRAFAKQRTRSGWKKSQRTKHLMNRIK